MNPAPIRGVFNLSRRFVVLIVVCALFLIGLPAARAMVAETEPPPAGIPPASAIVATEEPPPDAQPGLPPEAEVPAEELPAEEPAAEEPAAEEPAAEEPAADSPPTEETADEGLSAKTLAEAPAPAPETQECYQPNSPDADCDGDVDYDDYDMHATRESEEGMRQWRCTMYKLDCDAPTVQPEPTAVPPAETPLPDASCVASLPAGVPPDLDTDKDGIHNWCDTDHDNDGVVNEQDPDWDNDEDGTPNGQDDDWLNDDGDDLVNSQDPDDNNDGLVDGCVPNATQDADCDGVNPELDDHTQLQGANPEMARQWRCTNWGQDCDPNAPSGGIATPAATPTVTPPADAQPPAAPTTDPAATPPADPNAPPVAPADPNGTPVPGAPNGQPSGQPDLATTPVPDGTGQPGTVDPDAENPGAETPDGEQREVPPEEMAAPDPGSVAAGLEYVGVDRETAHMVAAGAGLVAGFIDPAATIIDFVSAVRGVDAYTGEPIPDWERVATIALPLVAPKALRLLRRTGAMSKVDDAVRAVTRWFPENPFGGGPAVPDLGAPIPGVEVPDVAPHVPGAPEAPEVPPVGGEVGPPADAPDVAQSGDPVQPGNEPPAMMPSPLPGDGGGTSNGPQAGRRQTEEEFYNDPRHRGVFPTDEMNLYDGPEQSQLRWIEETGEVFIYHYGDDTYEVIATVDDPAVLSALLRNPPATPSPAWVRERMRSAPQSSQQARDMLDRDLAQQASHSAAAAEALRKSYTVVPVSQLPDVTLDDLSRQGRPAIDPSFADANWPAIAAAAKRALSEGMDPLMSREQLTAYGRQLGLSGSSLEGFVSLFREPIRWNPAQTRLGNGEHRLWAARQAGITELVVTIVTD
jgi:hypothetical protein